MYNYSKLAYQLKRSICSFCERLSKGLPVPVKKFITCIIYGILASNTVCLAEISRKLQENILLKKTIERLSRNLQKFSRPDVLYKNLSYEVKRYIYSDTPIIIDLSDLVKKYGVVFENMGRVRDGSTREIDVDGYFLIEAQVVNYTDKLPVPVYTDVFSQYTQDFKSENDEVLKCIDSLKSLYGTRGIYTMDRGMDNVLYFNYLDDASLKFSIRLKKNRNVLVKGNEINITKLVAKYKGKYSAIVRKMNGKSRRIRYGFIPVVLPEIPGKTFNLVFVRGYTRNTFYLLTNMNIEDGKDCLKVIAAYISRWKVEEFIRFKKTQFAFEDIRVQTFNRIKNMNLLLTLAVSYIALSSKSPANLRMIYTLENISKRIYEIPDFIYYSVSDGVRIVLSKTNTGIKEFLISTEKPLSQQLTLFNLPCCKGLALSYG